MIVNGLRSMSASCRGTREYKSRQEGKKNCAVPEMSLRLICRCLNSLSEWKRRTGSIRVEVRSLDQRWLTQVQVSVNCLSRRCMCNVADVYSKCNH